MNRLEAARNRIEALGIYGFLRFCQPCGLRNKEVATTLEALLVRLREELSRTEKPVDVQSFVVSHYPYDVQTGQLLTKAFGARLLRGRLCARSVHFEGYVSGVADDMSLTYY